MLPKVIIGVTNENSDVDERRINLEQKGYFNFVPDLISLVIRDVIIVVES